MNTACKMTFKCLLAFSAVTTVHVDDWSFETGCKTVLPAVGNVFFLS